MRRAFALVLLALPLVAAGAGCAVEDGQLAFQRSPRGSHIESLAYRIRMEPSGALAVRMTAAFLDDEGGVLAVPKPLLGTVDGLQVDGEPVDGTTEFETINVPVTGRTATATYVITGAVKAGTDITTIETPLVAAPSDASRQDPPVDVSAVLFLPEQVPPAEIDFHWLNAIDEEQKVKAGKVRFSGRSPIWTSSDLLVGLPPGVAPGLAGAGFGAITSRTAFDTQVSAGEATSDALESTLASQDLQHRLLTWMVVGIAGAVSLLILFQWYRTQTADRRARERLRADFPDHIVDPPNLDDPPVVALLLGDAKRLDQDAVAGTVLDLAHRQVITIDGYGPDEWVLRVPGGAVGETTAEQLVLDALRAQAPTGEVVGPPLWADRRPAWWRAYRADVFKRAKDADLIRRRFRFLYVGPFAAGLVAATWPLWLGLDDIWIVPAATILLGLVFAIPLRGGFQPTLEGVRSAGKWQAFGRYTADQGHWGDVGPAGIIVWGPYLAYGTVLGTCPYATAQLAPTGGHERAKRSEAQDQVDAEEAAATGSA